MEAPHRASHRYSSTNTNLPPIQPGNKTSKKTQHAGQTISQTPNSQPKALTRNRVNVLSNISAAISSLLDKIKNYFLKIFTGQTAASQPLAITTQSQDYSTDDLEANQKFLQALAADLRNAGGKRAQLAHNKNLIFNKHLNFGSLLKQNLPDAKLHRYQFHANGTNISALTIPPQSQTLAEFSKSFIPYGQDQDNLARIDEAKGNDMTRVNVTKVDFANKYLGGAWCNEGLGFAQEEQLVAQHPPIALLLAKGANTKQKRKDNDGGILTRTGNENAGKGTATPQLFRGPALYAMPLPNEVLKNINQSHTSLVSDLTATKANYSILAMAAPMHSKNTPHNMTSLEDLFVTAYTGFKGTVDLDTQDNKKTWIDTGLWGAGNYNNNPDVVIAVQYLAARLAGVERIRFYGIKDDNKAINITNNIEQIIQNNPQASAQELLQIIMQNQNQLG